MMVRMKRGVYVNRISSLSPDIPFHLSAYHPAYRYSKAPTSKESLAHLTGIAKQYLPFVYIGNVGFENHTFCPG